MNSLERAQPLIEAIYEGAVDPPRWQGFVERLSDATGGTAVTLSLQLPGAVPGREVYRVGMHESYSDRFLQHVRKGLPWGPIVGKSRVDEGFSLPSDRFSDDALAATDFYKDFMKPQGLAPEAPLIHRIADSDFEVPSGVAIFRRLGGRPFGASDFELVNLLVPHLKRAFTIAVELGSIQRSRLALMEVLDRIPIGISLLDEHGQPVVVNREAHRIFEQGDGITLGRHGPEAAHPTENRVLRARLDGVLNTTSATLPPDAFMNVSRTSGGRGYAVLVSPLMEAPPDSTSRDAAVAVFVTDSEGRQVSTAEVLQSLYSLSQAESELVQLLSSGYSLEEVAQQRHVTMNTVRTQLKRVFSKTQTTGQADLVQMVLTGVAAIRDE